MKGTSAVIEAINKATSDLDIEVEGEHLKVSHLDKILWPAAGKAHAITKRDLARYYTEVCEFLLPHLEKRPIAIVRYPEGFGGEHFFQKHMPQGAERYWGSVSVYSESNHKPVDYALTKGLGSLLWLAQMGALEIHPWHSRTANAGDHFDTQEAVDESLLNKPDFLVIDLDPYTYSGKEAPGAEPELNKEGWEQVVKVAKALRTDLDALGIDTYVKTSGKTGLHIFVPVEPSHTYEEIRGAAKAIGEHLMDMLPDLVTMEWSVKNRPAKVFFDFGQNALGKTLASAYSPRATASGLVSYPLKWEELEKVYPTDFDIRTVPDLLNTNGDRWDTILNKPFKFSSLDV